MRDLLLLQLILGQPKCIPRAAGRIGIQQYVWWTSFVDPGAAHPWPGAYSSDEILFLSAISPFLHAQDALNCPSRLARLCEAIFQLVSTNQIE
jgi:hypothetical protein